MDKGTILPSFFFYRGSDFKRVFCRWLWISINQLCKSWLHVRIGASQDWHRTSLYGLVKANGLIPQHTWSIFFHKSQSNLPLYHRSLIPRLYWSLDMMFSFTTGFYDAGVLVLDLRRTTMNYLKLGPKTSQFSFDGKLCGRWCCHPVIQHSYWQWWSIVSFPIQNCDFP